MLPDDAHCPADTTEALLELTVGQLLASRAASRPERTALVDGNAPRETRRRWSYRRLLDTATAAAALPLDRFEPGDRIAIWGANVPEWEIAQLGAAMGGMVVVTVNPALTEQEIGDVLRQADVSGALYQHDMAAGTAGDVLRAAARGRLPDDAILRLADFAGLTAPATPPAPRRGEHLPPRAGGRAHRAPTGGGGRGGGAARRTPRRDRRGGRRPGRSGAPPDQGELLAVLRTKLARHKLPARWFVQDALPMTASGKIRKFELRDELTTRL